MLTDELKKNRTDRILNTVFTWNSSGDTGVEGLHLLVTQITEQYDELSKIHDGHRVTADARRTSVGWDKDDNPIVRLIEPCGCRFFQTGKLEKLCQRDFKEAMTLAGLAT